MKAFVRPRPCRIAFLVDENENWQSMLQAIFANCYGRWGGRFSLIIPCENGNIRPAYLPWLEAYDPDIMYSYVDLEDLLVESLHQRFYPSFLTKHSFSHQDKRDSSAFRPNIPVSPLTSMSGTWLASRGSVLSDRKPVKIVDFFGRNAPQFVQENFGFYSESLSPWPIPANLSEYAQDVSLVDKAIAENQQFSPRPRGEFVTDYHTFLNRIAVERDISGLAIMSAWMAPRLQMNDPRWSNRVNIIVGDSFVDRVTFWNARSHLSVYLDSSLVTLKVSADDINDDTVFSAILAILKNKIHVSHSGNNSLITIRSASHTVEELDAFVSRFQNADKWNMYSREVIDSIDQTCPSAGVLETSMQHVEDSGPFRLSDWHEIVFNEMSFRPPIITPRHIRDMPTVSSDITRGVWSLDIDIERSVDHSRFENVKHSWRLPRSLRLTQAFTRGYSLNDSGSNHCLPRVSIGGMLSLMCAIKGQLPELTVPDDELAIRYALCAPRDWLPFAPGRGPHSNSLFYHMRPSDKGRYLTALNHLSGGIHRSRAIFLNQFWKRQFEMLGASTQIDADKIPELVKRLQKRLRSGRIENDEEWQRIAKIVQSEARSIRLDSRYLRYDFLSERFEEFRNSYWATHQSGAPREEWDEWEKNSLSRSIQYLCDREILHQGHEWLCPRCNNTNWVSISALRQTLVCEICGQTKSAPVAAPWHFKLNAFVTEGLRAHGLLAELWCLSRLSDQAHTSFYFLEPQELFFLPPMKEYSTPDAEIDLIAIVDGVVHLCEAKTSNHIDIPKLAKLAMQMKPDVVTLAIMETRSPAIQRRSSELERLLVGSKIQVELLVLEKKDIEDSPDLPTGLGQLTRLL